MDSSLRTILRCSSTDEGAQLSSWIAYGMLLSILSVVSPMRELDWGKEWLVSILSAVYHVQVWMIAEHEQEWLHAVIRQIIKDIPLQLHVELESGKEWLMVCSEVSHLLSIMFKCKWLLYMHCICIGMTTCRPTKDTPL